MVVEAFWEVSHAGFAIRSKPTIELRFYIYVITLCVFQTTELSPEKKKKKKQSRSIWTS